MKATILTKDIWPKITAEAEVSSSDTMVAVAFFATGAASMLPLKKGSVLVVNASNSVIKSGQTNPSELIKLLRKGVKIFSCDNLHAKIFVLGNKLFIGSANVSNNSSNDLLEAMLMTTDKSLIGQAKKTIKSLCFKDLGLERLKQLVKIYSPPKFVGGMPTSSKRIPKKQASDFYVCNLIYKDYPKGTEDAYEKGKLNAEEKKTNAQHQILDFWWGRKVKFKVGDTLFMILKDGNGDHDIYPPGTIIHISKWKDNHFLTYVEALNKRVRKLSVLAKKMDTSSLKRSGYKNEEVAKKILKAWNG